jgi:hypothetical protein
MIVVGTIVGVWIHSEIPQISNNTAPPPAPQISSPEHSSVPPRSTTQTATPEPSIFDLETALKTAKQRELNARFAVITALGNDPKYISAQQTVKSLSHQVEATRNGGDGDIQDLAKQLLDARPVMGKLETAALAENAEEQAAVAEVAGCKSRYDFAAAAKRIADEKTHADFRRELADEQAKIDNGPMNIVIRKHQLIEGMTIAQAVESLGNPYSISKSGNTTVLDWARTDGDYWSGIFVDDSAVTVTHTRF